MTNDPTGRGATHDGGHRARKRPWVAVPVLALTLLAACGGGDDTSPTPPTSAATSTTAARAETTARPAGTAPTRPTPAEPAAVDLANGSHPVYLTAVDTGRRAITVDLVQLIDRSSAEAKTVCPEIAGGDVDGYCIKNVNAQLRTLPIPTSASLSVLSGSGQRKVDLAGLAAARRPQKEDSFFEVTVSGGKVTRVKELYRP